MALDDVEEQTQSASQSIKDSDETSLNEVDKPIPLDFTSGTAAQRAAQAAQLEAQGFLERWPSNIYRR